MHIWRELNMRMNMHNVKVLLAVTRFAVAHILQNDTLSLAYNNNQHHHTYLAIIMRNN